jgi:hypothetical protein
VLVLIGRAARVPRPMRPLSQHARSGLIAEEVTAAGGRTGRLFGRKVPRSPMVITGSGADHSTPALR